MLPLCADQGIGVIPWSPLARGRLARPWGQHGATDRPQTDAFGKALYDRTEAADKEVVAAVGQVADQLGVSYSEVSLAWLLQKPEVTAPIIGVTKPEHLADAIKALDLQLDSAAIQALEQPYIPHPNTWLEPWSSELCHDS